MQQYNKLAYYANATLNRLAYYVNATLNRLAYYTNVTIKQGSLFLCKCNGVTG
jgi:hypothetical protein